MKTRTLNLINKKLNLLEQAIKENNSVKCQEIYNNIPSTGWKYFIDEVVNRGLGRIEGALLKWNY
jgi:hypothetical protein